MKPVVFALVFLFAAQPLLADPLLLEPDSRAVSPGSRAGILRDPAGELSLADAEAAASAGKFAPSSARGINLGFTQDVIWLRIPVQNRANRTLWYLDVAYPPLDRVTVYVVSRLGTRQSTGGRMQAAADKEIAFRNLVFRLDFPEGESTVYMRIQSDSSMSVPMTIWEGEAFLEHVNFTNYGQGLYFGILCVLAAYNLFLFFSVREIAYIYYTGYVLCFGAFIASLNGMGAELLWPRSPEFGGFARVLFIALTSLFLVLFSRAFLDTKTARWLDIALLGSFAFFALLIVLIPVVPIRFLNRSVTLSAGLFSLLLIISGLRSVIAGYRPARYYLAAFTVFLVGTIAYSMRSLGLLDPGFFVDNSMQVGSAAEGILLSLALADRINLMKKEQAAAQEASLNRQIALTHSYARFVPDDFLQLLDKHEITEIALGDAQQLDVTVLFSDIRSFTSLTETMTAKESFDFLNGWMGRVAPVIRSEHGYVDKYIGDGIMALFPKSADDAVRAAVEMQRTLDAYNARRLEKGYTRLQIGVGVNTGSVTLGTVGEPNRMDGTCVSDTVNLAARTEGLTKVYGTTILITAHTLVQLSDPTEYHYRFLDRVNVRGKEHAVSIFEVYEAESSERKELKRRSQADFEAGVLHFHDEQWGEAKAAFARALAVNPADGPTDYYIGRIAARVGG